MAYDKEVSGGYETMTCTQESIEMFTHATAPCSSQALGDITGLRVLDLACGSGRFTRWLKTTKQAGAVVGVDMSEHMIQRVNS